MKRSDVIRTLSWLVPVVCFVLAGLLVYLQFKKLETTRAELAKAKNDMTTLENQIRNFQSISGRDRIPFVYDSRLEEAMFLDSVRRLALGSKVDLDRYANQTPPPPPPNSPPKPGEPPAMKSVKTLVSLLEIRGNYGSVRAFMKQLLSSQRLLAVKSGAWTRGENPNETVFQFILHRYVSTAPPPIPPKAAAMASTVGEPSTP